MGTLISYSNNLYINSISALQSISTMSVYQSHVSNTLLIRIYTVKGEGAMGTYRVDLTRHFASNRYLTSSISSIISEHISDWHIIVQQVCTIIRLCLYVYMYVYMYVRKNFWIVDCGFSET